LSRYTIADDVRDRIVMDQEQSAKIHGKPVERVGAIIVHGIGEQKRFEFLEQETRKIVDAIIAKYGQRRRDVTPTLTTGVSDPYLGEQAGWVSGREAPLHCLVELDTKIVDIAFHEVWWADINETLTIGKQIRFWAWGLSLAGIATHNDRFLPGALTRTRPPANADSLTPWNRIRMGFVSALFGFSAFSVALVNLILKQLGFSRLPLTATIVNYLSAVRLYSQNKRAGGSPMEGPDEPPRAAIRRRMIRVMVEVAEANYDRWYILAHSLGTVVAWNGLMEIQQALPNYLDEKCWNSGEMQALRGISGVAFNINSMMPNRPIWLGHREIVERDSLFKKFCGFLTYGSPLERFCGLWSAMVPINVVEDPFREDAEWVNVYDPTDPVGTWIEDFDPSPTPPSRPGHTKLTPQNFPCRASPILLLSHISYLTASRLNSLRLASDPRYLLVNQVADWLVSGGSLTARINASPRGGATFWMPRAATGPQTHQLSLGRVTWRFIQAGIVGLALTILTVLSLIYVIGPILRLLKGLAFPLVKHGLLWLHLSYLGNWISGFIVGATEVLASSSGEMDAISGSLAAYGFNSHIANVVVDSVALWIATAVVVGVASLINYHRTTNEREEMRAYSDYQRNLRND
jgi:hypothetical protein